MTSEEFIYKDKVEVISGFYKGQKGIVIDVTYPYMTMISNIGYERYLVKTSDASFFVNRNDLRKCE
jgi:ribosomal protein L24